MNKRHHFTAHSIRSTRAALAGLVVLSVGLTACGGGNDSAVSADTGSATVATTAPAAPTSAAPSTAASPPTTAPIGSYTDVQPAVVQILADGSFRDPEGGQVSGAGAGSGFIISPDGLAVTNNHVVTGAATLKVYVGGDTTHAYNAKVLGVSECNDLAVIDIAESAPLPSLEWSTGPIKAGLPVFAAGFPLGDPEFTITSGIVSKAESSGDMPWASLDSAIEHDAVIQPGNSGGPLVGADGHVVGVNYAFKEGITAPRYQAIRNDLARSVVDKLKSGDFESLGVNGDAFVAEDGSMSGIWVAGVAAGSPAAKAGLLPGDIITALNGLPMGRDGSKADYCDVLRTSGDTAPIDAEVLRLDTSEILRGEFRSDKPLVATMSFAEELTQDSVPTPTETGTAITGYQTVVDDTGVLTIDVPVEWSAVSTSPQDVEGTTYPFILASTDLDAFANSQAPGLVFTRIEGSTGDMNVTLAQFAPTGCTDAGTFDYSDAKFTGKYQVWANCDGTDTMLITVAAVPADGAYTAILVIQALTESDLDVLDQAFASFDIA